MRHGLRDVIDGDERVVLPVHGDSLEISPPILAITPYKIEQAAADAAHARNFHLAWPHALAEELRFKLLRACHDLIGIVDLDGDGADPGAVRDVMGMGESGLLVVHYEINLALRPMFHI